MQFAAHEIIEEKYLRIAAVFDGIGCLEYIHIQTAADKIKRQEY